MLIDNTNNNTWVPVTDTFGDVLAEIKANGNNLGIVNSFMYINNTAVREDENKILYLDRNLTLTPSNQPISTVDIRLYIKQVEYMALKNAMNSNGMPSGINSIDDVGIFKNNDGCLGAVQNIANQIVSVNNAWGSDYVLSATVNSFSSFYFANKINTVIPLSLLEFNGRLVNSNIELNWKTTDESNTISFEIERSLDGRTYTKIGNVAATNQAGIHTYKHVDKNIIMLGVPILYYRLKKIDINGQFTYSFIVPIHLEKKTSVILYPNPVTDKVNLIINVAEPEKVQLRLIDYAGRILRQLPFNLSVGAISLSFDINKFSNGVYCIDLKGPLTNYHKVFVKQ